MTNGDWKSEREAIDRWLAEPDDDDIVPTSRALQAISKRVVVWAAVSALRALAEDADGDPWIDPYHIERARLLADAIDAWLANPTDERLSVVRTHTGAVEVMWNDISGDSGQPQPVLAAATNTGWCAVCDNQLFNLTPALDEAERRLGPARVLAAVRAALANDPPWAAGVRPGNRA